MQLYSEDDKFARGLTVIMIVPLFVPHFFINTDDGWQYLIILIAIFFWMLALDGKTLWRFLQSETVFRRFAQIVISTVIINFIASFYIQERDWLFFVLLVWCLFLSLKAGKIYSKWQEARRLG